MTAAKSYESPATTANMCSPASPYITQPSSSTTRQMNASIQRTVFDGHQSQIAITQTLKTTRSLHHIIQPCFVLCRNADACTVPNSKKRCLQSPGYATPLFSRRLSFSTMKDPVYEPEVITMGDIVDPNRTALVVVPI